MSAAGPTTRPAGLGRLLRPRSVAVIGATERPRTLGSLLVRHLLAGEGVEALHLVNPRQAAVHGQPCLARIEDLPPGVDVAFILLGAERCPAALAACAAAGVRFAVIGSSGFGDGGVGAELEGELRDVLATSAIRLVGPNTNGLWNAIDDVRLGFNVSHQLPLRGGSIGLVSQSGAVLGSIIAELERHGEGIAYAVSTGNELDLELADYVRELCRDEHVRAIGLLVDAVGDPAALVEALRESREHAKPVVLLKIGTSESGRAATELHASRVADRTDALRALCERAGVAFTVDFDAFVASLSLLGSGRLRATDSVHGLSTSGAGAAIVADAASHHGFGLTPLGSEAEGALSELMRLTRPHNPLDITGESRDPDWVAGVLRAFAGADVSSPLVYFITLLAGDPPDARLSAYADLARDQPDRLFTALIPAALPAGYREWLVEAGVSVHTSVDACLGGLRLALDAQRAAERGVDAAWAEAWIPRVTGRAQVATGALHLHDRLRDELRAGGIGFAAEATVPAGGDVVAAARAIGYPVALKLLSPRHLHKVSTGAIALDVDSDVAAAREAERLAGLDATGQILVQAMVGEGIDLFVGYEDDPRYGPALIVGAGGSEVEELRDVRTLLLPVAADAVRRALSELRIAPAILARTGGRPMWDVDAAVASVCALVEHAERHALVAAEINPLRVLAAGHGAVAIDVRAVAGEAS